MAQVRNILDDVKKIDTIETNVGQLQTEVTNFDALPSQVGMDGKYLTTNSGIASWATITQPTLVSQLTNDSGYQTASQVSTAIAGLVNSAPSTLDTLNELAAALGNDANFSTTVTNSLATKLDYTKLADGTGHGFKVGPHLSYYSIQTEATTSGIYFNDGMGFIKANYVPVLYWDASKVTIKNSMFTDTITLNGSTGNVTATAFIGNGSQLTNLPQPDLSSYATQTYVNTQVSNLVNAAPAALDTLNELATALGNDANFSTTITNSLALKANQSTTYTKTEVDTSLATKANQNTTYTKTEVDNSLSLKVGMTSTTGSAAIPSGTTAQRPASPSIGDTRWNTTRGSLETFDGSNWLKPSEFIASGGAIVSTNGYKVHTFTSSGQFTVSSGSASVTVLTVGGGGAGGWDVGGGGGAGGYISSTLQIGPGTYNVVIGAGGTANTSGGGTAPNGSSTSVFGITALGGGGGGNYSGGSGASGGSGGGGAGYNSGFLAGGSGTNGQGYAGGNGRADLYGTASTGGGGGGSAGIGIDSTNNINSYAAGGAGTSNSISGSAVVYAAGGKGGGDNWTGPITSGAANSGNGGDGAGNPNFGGNGGSGIVIIRYAI